MIKNNEEKEMKKFEFTEQDRETVIELINNKSLLGAKNYLIQLKELVEERK